MGVEQVCEAVSAMTDAGDLEKVSRAVAEAKAKLKKSKGGYTPIGVDVAANPGKNPPK